VVGDSSNIPTGVVGDPGSGPVGDFCGGPVRGAAKGSAGNPGQRWGGGSPASRGKNSAGRPAGAVGVLPAVQGAESDMAPAAEGVECHMAGLKGLKGESLGAGCCRRCYIIHIYGTRMHILPSHYISNTLFTTVKHGGQHFSPRSSMADTLSNTQASCRKCFWDQ